MAKIKPKTEISSARSFGFFIKILELDHLNAESRAEPYGGAQLCPVRFSCMLGAFSGSTDREILGNEELTLGGAEKMASLKIRVNERVWAVSAAPDTPVLYVLSNELLLKGPRFGCGLAQCGSCSVLVEGVETRSCTTPVGSVENKSVTTLEGLPAWYAKQRGLSKAPPLHPVQEAMIDEQALQCGYCYNGMIIKAAELLSTIPRPSDAQIRSAMNGHLCRCGTYPRIAKAIQRASAAMSGVGK